jgi:replicative DNA helicase
VERLGRVPGVFYDLRNQGVWGAMVGMFEAGREVDAVTLLDGLGAQRDAAGGAVYVSELLDAAPSLSGLEGWIDVVLDRWLLRRAIGLGTELAAAGYEPGADGNAVMEGAERRVMELSAARSGKGERSAKVLAAEAVTRLEGYVRGRAQGAGIGTGFSYLDKMLGGGLHPKQLAVLAARPSMGKTSLGLMVAAHAALDLRVPTAVFSLEMTAEELVDRLLFQRSRGDYQRYRTGYLELEDLGRMLEGPLVGLAGAPLWIDDSADVTALELRSRARRLAAEHGVGLVVVDYLQLVRGDRRYSNRQEEVSDISRQMKGLAKELGVPVLVMAQLNRETERTSHRKPQLCDLRESGAIEQDADVVGLLWEPKLKEEEEARLEEMMGGGGAEDWSRRVKRVNLLIAKQRNGPTGDCELVFRKASMRFEGWDRKTAPVAGQDLEGEGLRRGEGAEEQGELAGV